MRGACSLGILGAILKYIYFLYSKNVSIMSTEDFNTENCDDREPAAAAAAAEIVTANNGKQTTYYFVL
jgi:hypothetical protein